MGGRRGGGGRRSSSSRGSSAPSRSVSSTPTATLPARPPPPRAAASPKNNNNTGGSTGNIAKGAALGMGGALLASMGLGMLSGTGRNMETSDLLYTGAGAVGGGGAYSLTRNVMRRPVGLVGTSACALVGGMVGLMYNGSRLEAKRAWEPQIDPGSGDTYYVNSNTGESSWTKP
eukprot:TRINITY_DN4185_c0_g1_i2.p1 TRINITY_DN4185_c0_g1~~TRINITY_DN4185_c0_g1_i2.p1  ORF type:complete len:174 (-),score=21.89 TRINITY_DN4185_c0_g1_i2:332-853(-)